MWIGIFLERGTSRVASSIDKGEYSVEASPADEILLAEMHRRQDFQQHEGDLLNTKSAIILGYLAAIGAMTLGLTQYISLGWQQRILLIVVLSTLAVVLYSAAIVCSIMAFHIRICSWPVPVEPDKVKAYRAQKRSEMIQQIIDQYSSSILTNIGQLKSRIKWFRRSVSLTIALTVVLVATTVATYLILGPATR